TRLRSRQGRSRSAGASGALGAAARPCSRSATSSTVPPRQAWRIGPGADSDDLAQLDQARHRGMNHATISMPAQMSALADQPRWVAWQYETVSGRKTKVPYSATGRKAKTNDPATWAPLSELPLGAFDGP